MIDPDAGPLAAAPPESAPPQGKARTGLLVSCGLLVLWWTGFAAWKLTRAEHPLPTSLEALFLRKLVEAAALAAITFVLLRASGESFASLGLGRRGIGRSILVGLGFAFLFFLVINVGLNPVVGRLLGGAVDASVRTLFQDPGEWPWWVGTAIVGGGFAEELLRAFALTRFERLLGRTGLVLALVVDSAVFGLGHLYQGTSGAVSAAIIGLLFAFVFLRRRRVTDAMAAHAWFDILGIATAYALYAPRS